MSRFGLGSTLARLKLDVVWVAMRVLGAILYAGSGFGGSSWERGLELAGPRWQCLCLVALD